MKIGIAKMQIIVTEIKRVKHFVCDRCHTDISESGSCVCDEVPKGLTEALNAV